MTIVWSPAAIADLEAIRDYIALDSVHYADLTVRRLFMSVGQLGRFPHSGRVVPEVIDPTLRELIRPPYRIVYRLRDDVIEVVTVFRASRRLD